MITRTSRVFSRVKQNGRAEAFDEVVEWCDGRIAKGKLDAGQLRETKHMKNVFKRKANKERKSN